MPSGGVSFQGVNILQVLVALDLVIKLVEDRLHDGGELHVKIEEVHDEGDGEEAEAYRAELCQQLAEFFRNILFPPYQDLSSLRFSRLGSTGSSCMTVRM